MPGMIPAVGYYRYFKNNHSLLICRYMGKQIQVVKGK
jgi:hypothetical protein